MFLSFLVCGLFVCGESWAALWHFSCNRHTLSQHQQLGHAIGHVHRTLEGVGKVGAAPHVLQRRGTTCGVAIG